MTLSNSENKNLFHDSTSPIAILGIGGGGVKIISAFNKLNSSKLGIKLGVLDFDLQSLSSFDGTNKISSTLPSPHSTMGAGGDIIVGERMIATVRKEIAEFISGSSMLIGVCGMGGGTGTAGSSIVARVSKKLGVPSIFVLTMPFSFEGHQRMQTADKGLENLLSDTDVAIPIHNDILYSMMPSETSMQEAFLKADAELAGAVESLAQLVTAKSYLSGTFADFKKILGRRKTSCSIGAGEALEEEGKDFCNLAVERLISAPLLGGIVELKKADAAAIILSGGKDLSIGAMKKTFEKTKALLGDNTEITCSTTISENMSGKIRIAILATRYDRSHETNSEKDKEQDELIKRYTQDELPLMTLKKGIFTNSSDNFFNNQDLDIPTFQRKGVIVDTGK